jgi:hypothetical protein
MGLSEDFLDLAYPEGIPCGVVLHVQGIVDYDRVLSYFIDGEEYIPI